MGIVRKIKNIFTRPKPATPTNNAVPTSNQYSAPIGPDQPSLQSPKATLPSSVSSNTPSASYSGSKSGGSSGSSGPSTSLSSSTSSISSNSLINKPVSSSSSAPGSAADKLINPSQQSKTAFSYAGKSTAEQVKNSQSNQDKSISFKKDVLGKSGAYYALPYASQQITKATEKIPGVKKFYNKSGLSKPAPKFLSNLVTYAGPSLLFGPAIPSTGEFKTNLIASKSITPTQETIFVSKVKPVSEDIYQVSTMSKTRIGGAVDSYGFSQTNLKVTDKAALGLSKSKSFLKIKPDKTLVTTQKSVVGSEVIGESNGISAISSRSASRQTSYFIKETGKQLKYDKAISYNRMAGFSKQLNEDTFLYLGKGPNAQEAVGFIKFGKNTPQSFSSSGQVSTQINKAITSSLPKSTIPKSTLKPYTPKGMFPTVSASSQDLNNVVTSKEYGFSGITGNSIRASVGVDSKQYNPISNTWSSRFGSSFGKAFQEEKKSTVFAQAEKPSNTQPTQLVSVKPLSIDIPKTTQTTKQKDKQINKIGYGSSGKQYPRLSQPLEQIPLLKQPQLVTPRLAQPTPQVPKLKTTPFIPPAFIPKTEIPYYPIKPPVAFPNISLLDYGYKTKAKGKGSSGRYAPNVAASFLDIKSPSIPKSYFQGFGSLTLRPVIVKTKSGRKSNVRRKKRR